MTRALHASRAVEGGSSRIVAGAAPARAGVLVIDDDVHAAERLRGALARRGYAVTVAREGAGLVELARRHHFDVAVLGVRRPLDLLGGLKAVDAAMGVIVATPPGISETTLTLLRRGAWACLSRPPPIDELHVQLERALEHRRLRLALDLYESGYQLLSSLSAGELRPHVLELARQVFRVPTAVLLLQPSGGESEWELQSQGPDPEEAVAVVQRLFVEPRRMPELPWSGRVEGEPETAHLTAVGRFDRVLAYPLRARQRCLGLLVALGHDPTSWSSTDEQRGRLLALQAALALDNARIYAALESTAVIDELTGLHSRRYLLDIVRRARPEAVTEGTSFLMVDVDHFKQVNDRFGHATGDRVLRRVAELLLRATRDTDVVARIGGEEFAVLLPRTDEETATDVAERVRATVALHTGEGRQGEEEGSHKDPQVTVSVGVASLQGGLVSGDEDPLERAALLMERADVALYRAKRAGRNRVCVWRSRREER